VAAAVHVLTTAKFAHVAVKYVAVSNFTVKETITAGGCVLLLPLIVDDALAGMEYWFVMVHFEAVPGRSVCSRLGGHGQRFRRAVAGHFRFYAVS
jgi:hypothetical protein